MSGGLGMVGGELAEIILSDCTEDERRKGYVIGSIVGNTIGGVVGGKIADNTEITIGNAGPGAYTGYESNTVKNHGYKTFSTLKNAIGRAGEGKDWHHIVEQSQIEKSGFLPEQIHNVDNIIAIDHDVHMKIIGYYKRKDLLFTDGLSVRDWLSGQSFEEQYNFGLDVLKMFGVDF